MSQLYVARVHQPRNTGVTRDTAINQFSFDLLEENTATYEAIADVLAGLYITEIQQHYSGNDNALNFYRSDGVLADDHTVTVHRIDDMSTGLPSVEVFSKGYSPAGLSTIPSMPSECSVVLTNHAELTGTTAEEARRRRGRNFFGPGLGAGDWPSTIDGAVRVSQSMVDKLRDFGRDLATQSAAATNWTWVCWSRADGEMREIVGGWVDAVFDTQRSRSLEGLRHNFWVPAP